MLKIIIDTEGHLPIFCADDRIFLGEGLFETIRVEERQVIYPQLHWKRMRESAKQLGIYFNLHYEAWLEHLNNTLQAAGLVQGGIKILLSSGHAKRGLIEQSDSPILLFKAFEYMQMKKEFSLASAEWLRDAKNPIYRVKSVNYLESIIARRNAIKAGVDDVLFFNLDHHATETTVANIFIIHQDKLYTPKIDDGLLPGIMRARILHLCAQKGIFCQEISIDQQTIHQAQAVFTVNVLQKLRVVKLFDGHSFSTEHPILSMIEQFLDIDIKQQIQQSGI